MIPSLIVIPLVKPTVQRFGKREAAAAPMLIGILAAAGIVFLPITPDNTGMMIYIILAVLINSSCIFFSTVVWALVADSVDYQELQTGKMRRGNYICNVFSGKYVRKLAQGVGVSEVPGFMHHDSNEDGKAEVLAVGKVSSGQVKHICADTEWRRGDYPGSKYGEKPEKVFFIDN